MSNENKEYYRKITNCRYTNDVQEYRTGFQ